MTTVEQAYRAARRQVGLPAFERNCRLTEFGSRKQKAWKVPGTREAGIHSQMLRDAENAARRIVEASAKGGA